MFVRELSLNGFPGQVFIVFDDFGDPSGALEDLGGSLQHSKWNKIGKLGILAHRGGQEGVLKASRVDLGAHFGSL